MKISAPSVRTNNVYTQPNREAHEFVASVLNPVLELSLCKKGKRYFLDAAATCALCWLFLLGKQSAAFHTNVSLRAKYIYHMRTVRA